MGKRYQAILKYLEVPFIGFDLKTSPTKPFIEWILNQPLKIVDAIIASPTETHEFYLGAMLGYGVKRILCEKPISASSKILSSILRSMNNRHVKLDMMFQYAELNPASLEASDHTIYDYFRHGSDGLFWDCVQLLALAESTIELRETSPHWKCILNGRILKLSEMDDAYVSIVKKWKSGVLETNWEAVVRGHVLAEKLTTGEMTIDELNRSRALHSGAIDIH